ncbi:MAG: mannose-1-phosphate guanylyltransferase [Thermodesulfobacteriota bacterium]
MNDFEMKHLFALIMAGGRGTRFWPLSREHRPKQLLALAGPTALLRETVDRIQPLVPSERILVVTGAAHAGAVAEMLPELPPANVLAEPVGRNTAPCIGLGAHWVMQRDQEGLMLVLPADHAITRPDAFRAVAAAGLQSAWERKTLVTLGLKPDRPETGYGYIEAGSEGASLQGFQVLPVIRFHEKPTPEEARAYLATGRFYWNSGIFIWPARVILEWIKRLLPDLAMELNELASGLGGSVFETMMAERYRRLPAVSIDYGVMERAKGALVLPADFGWSDVGSWRAAAEYWPRREGHAAQARVVSVDSTGCLVYSPDKLVALVGVTDLVVVETPDALLICAKNRDQDVRRVVEALEKSGRLDLL